MQVFQHLICFTKSSACNLTVITTDKRKRRQNAKIINYENASILRHAFVHKI